MCSQGVTRIMVELGVKQFVAQLAHKLTSAARYIHTCMYLQRSAAGGAAQAGGITQAVRHNKPISQRGRRFASFFFFSIMLWAWV